MVTKLFEQAQLNPPECAVEFVQDNLDTIVASEVSPFDIAIMAGEVALSPLRRDDERHIIAQIHDRRLFPIRQTERPETSRGRS